MTARSINLVFSTLEPIKDSAIVAQFSNQQPSPEAKADIEVIEDNVRMALAMAPFLRVGAP